MDICLCILNGVVVNAICCSMEDTKNLTGYDSFVDYSSLATMAPSIPWIGWKFDGTSWTAPAGE